jgi:hypothetical protein
MGSSLVHALGLYLADTIMAVWPSGMMPPRLVMKSCSSVSTSCELLVAVMMDSSPVAFHSWVNTATPRRSGATGGCGVFSRSSSIGVCVFDDVLDSEDFGDDFDSCVDEFDLFDDFV